MRHEAIEMVCAHVGQGREPPPHHIDELGASNAKCMNTSNLMNMSNLIQLPITLVRKMGPTSYSETWTNTWKSWQSDCFFTVCLFLRDFKLKKNKPTKTPK